jgi:hypothetical protein
MRPLAIGAAGVLVWLVAAAFSACAANDPIPLPKPGFDAAIGDGARDVTSAVAP